LYDQQAKIIDLKTCQNLKGQHNWQNAAMAYAACHAAGVPTLKIIKGMQSYPGLAHRQNIVATMAASPTSTTARPRMTRPHPWRCARLRTFTGSQAENQKASGYADCEKYLGHVRHAFLIGAAEEEIAAWLRLRKIPVTKSGTIDKAVAAAHDMAQKDANGRGVVLLSPACASFDQFRNFEHRGEVFAQLVQEIAAKKKTKVKTV